MQELLTKGIGHKEFKDTEIGRIPKEWKVIKLGEIITLKCQMDYQAQKCPDQTKEISYIKMDDIGNGNVVPAKIECLFLKKII